jgi:hypothetical protein
MPENDHLVSIDWSLTTWEGARREQLRRWALLPLENIVAALEEMETFVQQTTIFDAEAGSAKKSLEKP